MTHGEIVNKFIPIVQELYDRKGNDISEKDIQVAFIEKFNTEKHRKFYAKKECENRRDIGIYRKHPGKTKDSIELIYELKTYFKESEEIYTSLINYDLEKLHNTRSKEKEVKAYFIAITTNEHLVFRQNHKPKNPMFTTQKVTIGDGKNKFEVKRIRKDKQSENFKILTWEVF